MLPDNPKPWARSGWEGQGARSGQGAAELVLPGPGPGKMQGEAACLRVSRPGREKKRRLRVLVVITGSPGPMRVVQWARLCAITWTASQAALAGKRPERRWLRPTPYFRSRMAFSISAWRRWSASRPGLGAGIRFDPEHYQRQDGYHPQRQQQRHS